MTLHFITIIAGLHRGGELRQYLLVLLAVKELRLLGVWWPAICRRDAATPLQELLRTVVPVHNALNGIGSKCCFVPSGFDKTRIKEKERKNENVGRGAQLKPLGALRRIVGHR